MCKKYDEQQRAIGDFLAAMRGENATECRAIYEHDLDGKLDLIGFFAVIDYTFGLFYKLVGAAISGAGSIPYYGGMGNRAVARAFGADYAAAI